MTEEERTAMHKKAFRVAFDTLNKLWPTENSAEYFAKKAMPVCTVAFEDEMKDNPLGRRLVLAVWGYLEEAAGEKT